MKAPQKFEKIGPTPLDIPRRSPSRRVRRNRTRAATAGVALTAAVLCGSLGSHDILNASDKTATAVGHTLVDTLLPSPANTPSAPKDIQIEQALNIGDTNEANRKIATSYFEEVKKTRSASAYLGLILPKSTSEITGNEPSTEIAEPFIATTYTSHGPKQSFIYFISSQPNLDKASLTEIVNDAIVEPVSGGGIIEPGDIQQVPLDHNGHAVLHKDANNPNSPTYQIGVLPVIHGPVTG